MIYPKKKVTQSLDHINEIRYFLWRSSTVLGVRQREIHAASSLRERTYKHVQSLFDLFFRKI